jgi:dihydropyrimidine dehydrogenase (NAD+) subunit PreT
MHRLAMGPRVRSDYDAREKLGGLNEYGIAAYKTPGDFAQTEVDWLVQSIGGITDVHTTARRWDATSRSPSCGRSSTRCFSAWGFPASMR